MTLAHPEYSRSGDPLSIDLPITEDQALRERIFAGVMFEDDPRAAPPQAFIRIPGPVLRHSPGGCSASIAVDGR